MPVVLKVLKVQQDQEEHKVLKDIVVLKEPMALKVHKVQQAQEEHKEHKV